MGAILWISGLTAAQLAGLRAANLTTSIPQLAVHGLLSLLSSTIIWTLFATYFYPALLSPLRHLPLAPGGLTPLGHFQTKGDSPTDTSHERWIETIPNDGLIRVREAFGGDAVIATSPAMLKAVLLDQPYSFEKAHGIRKILRLVLGDGLIVVEGDAHKFQKGLLRSSFGAGPIKDLYPLFWEKSITFLNALDASLKKSNYKDRVEFCNFCSSVTLDIIGVSALGEDFDTLNKPAHSGLTGEYHELLRVDTERAIWFALSFFLPEWVVANIPFWKTPKVATRITTNMHKFAVELAKKRRAEVASGGVPDLSEKGLPMQRPDVLSNLVRTTNLNDSQLADQVLTFLAAGHETTSSTLAWTAVALGKDEKLQARLREEIRANVPSPSSGEIPEAALLDKLPLLNAVCHEGIRLFPPVPFSARTATKDVRLGDLVLPAGGQVWLPIWAINRATHLWGPNAAEFNPDRWITDGAFNNNGGAPSNYAIMTFLHGPRTCIGQGFTKGELRCLVAALFGRYHVKLAEDASNYIPEGLVTVKPGNGGLLKMEIVEGW